MVMRNLVAVFFLSIIGFVGWFAFSLGFFKEVNLRIEQQGPLYLVYKDHVGPYHFISKTISDVERWAKTEKIDCSSSFGEYLDDPNVVEHERLRSRAGCFLKSRLTSRPPSDLQFSERPEQKYVVAEFEGSPALGPYKVYNKVEEFLAEKRLVLSGPVIEVYEMKSETVMLTRYLFPFR
jgi:DNA gyrase inhibitor GyrI